jgi:hypothetical protein
MKIECSFQVELPFVLNLPTQGFDVVTAGGTVRLDISNEYYVVQFWNGNDPRSAGMLLGSLADLSARTGQQLTSPPAKKLRTVVRHDFAVDVIENDLPTVSSDEEFQAMQREVILASPEHLAKDELDQRAKAALDGLNAESRASFVLHERVRRRGQTELHRLDPYFLQALNRLIRWYAVEMQDFFVEEVGLHQLAATTTRGVLRTIAVDGRQLEAVPVVGKVPPLLHSPWMKPNAAAVTSLAGRLAAADDPDFADVLVLRARHLLERTAFRNAIAEAAASLEIAVARAIRRAMSAAGKTTADIDAELAKTKMKFPERAEVTLKSWCTKGALELDAPLWAQIKQDRTQHRNAVVHSDREPLAADAEAVVERFAKMTVLVRKNC